MRDCGVVPIVGRSGSPEVLKMLETPLVFLTLLVGQTSAATQPAVKQKSTPKAAAPVDRDKAVSEYNFLKEKTPMTAAARWKLAIWCEEHGLADLAFVHLGEVISLDPGRDVAWRKLGFKKLGNRWASEAEIAEDLERKKADKRWGPQLRKVHKDIHGSNGKAKRLLAEAELDKITDPRAVVSVYREFGAGGETDHWILVDFLRRIDKPMSSKALALISVYGKSKDIRRAATDVLRGRPSDDFIDVLVGLMTDEYRYEVRPVGGPGSPGVLFVEGEKFNVSRFYAPPAAPNIVPQPGDMITYDQYGEPIINRPMRRVAEMGPMIMEKPTATKRVTKQQEEDVTEYAQISPSQLAMEAQRGALGAKNQLEDDVELIKSINKERKTFNELVMAVAKDVTGKDGIKTPKEWRETLAGGKGFSKRPSSANPTYGEMVALAYNPVFGPAGFTARGEFRVHVRAWEIPVDN